MRILCQECDPSYMPEDNRKSREETLLNSGLNKHHHYQQQQQKTDSKGAKNAAQSTRLYHVHECLGLDSQQSKQNKHHQRK